MTSTLFDGKWDPKRGRRLVKDAFNQMIVSLVQNIEDGRIDMNPPYQRGLVWTPAQKCKLINSIIAGLQLPSIYFREMPLSAQYVYEVVDGKQRLDALRGFLRDEWAYNGNVFSKSPKDFQAFMYTITVPGVYVKGLSDEDTVELYERLNFGGVPHVDPRAT